MIQVLQRAVRVLGILAEREPMTLAELTEATGLKKPTLCLILKSMVELGCLEKAGSGIYITGSKLQELAALPRRRSTVRSLAEQAAAHLAEEVRESVVAAVAYHGIRYTIAQASYRQALMVDASVQAKGNFYTNATGRILLAFMPTEEREAIITRDGMPAQAVWAEAATESGLHQALAMIREKRLMEMQTAGGTVAFISVPVFGPDQTVWLALGVSLPASRCLGDHREQIITGLQKSASELSGHFCIRTDWSPGNTDISPDTVSNP